MNGYAAEYRGRKVMITGGLGFLGSSLAHRLVALGAEVLLVDFLIPQYGGNLFNVAGIEDRVRINISDVRDENSMKYLVQGQDIIFNLAGQVSHLDSMEDPYSDLEINCRSQLSILEVCRRHNPGVKLVYAGTRQQYGRPDYLPLDERHLMHPTDVNGINKMAGEWYHIVYNNVYGLRSTSLRLTNCYGPRQYTRDARQGFIGWFVRLLVECREISIYEPGTQLRDLNFVDDVVEAFLLAGASEEANGQVFNLGGDPISHLDLVELMIELAGCGSYTLVPFPPARKAIDIGDVYSSFARIKETLGWEPTVPLAAGLRRTIDYYRANWRHYWEPAEAPAQLVAREIDHMLASRGAIPLNDIRPQYDQIREEVDSAIRGVLESGWFVLGENLAEFEREFASFCGVKHCVGVSSGTDAIHIAVRALGIGPGDEVLMPPHTATFSALGISMSGARPTFVDVELETGNIDAWLIEKALTSRTRAVMPVHLYGQAADLDILLEVAASRGIPVVEDAAQAHGATHRGKVVGGLGAIGCFSFYPTKNLGAYGDGGALTTDDDDLAAAMRELRNGGQQDRYHHARAGFCNRLDELQAAVLRVKLRYLGQWNAARAERAALYDRLFAQGGVPVRPIETRGYGVPVYHLYVVRTPPGTREGLMAYLKEAGITSLIHYPVPVHLQPAYASLGVRAGSFPASEELAATVLSLPMYPELPLDDVERIVTAVADYYS